MNKTQLIAEVAEKAGITKVQAANVVEAVFESISGAMAKNDKVQLIGFGTFAAKYHKAKVSKNPRTGEAINVPATYRPAFAAGKALKDQVAKIKA